MTKRDKREEARSLRRQGISIIVIARQLKAPKSSVSTWCRDIQLTPEQEAALQHSDARRKAQVKGAGANVAIHREKRRRYQEQGRQKACEGDPLHLAGCMLYWAEGSKRRNMVEFVNSDPEMMVLFNRFLREALSVDKEKVKFSIRCYMGNGVPLTEIEDYWSTLLDISKDNISLRTVDKKPTSSQQKGRKLQYGTCHIMVYSTRLIQHIYGAIQEYAGIDRLSWLH